MLPIAVQWILVAMILLLIGEVSWIAFMQMRIAADNNKLELYGKRFRVFEAAATYIHHILIETKVSETALDEFNIATAGAIFLFQNDLNIYLEALRRRSLNLNALVDQLAQMHSDADGRDELIDRIEAWMNDFKMEYSRLVKTFTPYLKIEASNAFFADRKREILSR